MKKFVLVIAIIASTLSCYNVYAQKAFYPMSRTDYKLWGDGIDRVFDNDAEVNFIIDPSYSGSPALSIHSGLIKVQAGGKTYETKCRPELSTSFISLAKHSVTTANYYTSRRLGLDGITYFLYYKNDGVRCWAPNGLCGQAVAVFNAIINAIIANDNDLLEKQAAIADSTCNIFKTYYPEDFVDIAVYKSTFGSDPFNVSLKLFSNTGLSVSSILDLTFNFKRLKYRRRYKETYLQKYEDVLKEVGYWMYAQSDFVDKSNKVNFIVKDVKEPEIRKNEYGTYEILIKESGLTANNMISILQQL